MYDSQKNGDEGTVAGKKIPNNMLTIILTNCMTLRRMRTKARWVNKYLIPNTILTIILTTCMTLRDEGTMGEKIPNT